MDNNSHILKMLYPFQREGVKFIESTDGKALIADEMGLGKTFQAVAWSVMTERTPCLVVCPASLKENWRREIQKLSPVSSIEILSGSKPSFLGVIKADFVVINYDILRYWVSELIQYQFQTLILDECHRIKNKDTARTKAVFQLKHHFKHILCLSGTPILSRPAEIYSSLCLVKPDLFPTFSDFGRRYCGMKWNPFSGSFEFKGATNVQELHRILTSTVMIRRLKKDVLKDLPRKQRIIVPLTIDNMPEYKKASSDIRKWARENDINKDRRKAVDAKAKLEILKQIIVRGKIKLAVDWIEDYLEQQDKLIVFTWHIDTITQLKSHLGKYNPVVIQGSVSQKGRDEAVQKFQHDKETRLLIGNLRAAGEGLTLTAANATCFVEFGWTPAEHDQAEDRVHRIGQKADSVQAYYLIGIDTLEEDIAAILDRKRKILAGVLDGKTVADSDLLIELMQALQGGNKR